MSLYKKRVILFTLLTASISSRTVSSHTYSDTKICTEVRGYDVQRIERSSSNNVKTPINAKRIHFVRHAQGFHNVAGETDPIFGIIYPYCHYNNIIIPIITIPITIIPITITPIILTTTSLSGYLREDLEDAMLTSLGEQQCNDLAKSLDSKFFQNIKLILVSPMRRTIQTAIYSFPNQVKDKKVIFLANELIREQTGLHPCDRRRTISNQSLDFPRIDFSKIESDKDPIYKLYILREPEVLNLTHLLQYYSYYF